MQLIYSPASPFARKARMVILETGQSDDIELVNVASTPLAPNPQLTAANPLSKIPALLREDGPALYDSRVVTRFLDARAQQLSGVHSGPNSGVHSGTSLYPESRQWDVLTLEATGDAIMDAGVAMVYELRCRPEDKQYDLWMDAQWGKIEGALDALNSRWISHLAGPLDMGQISVGCALGYLDFRHDARNWRQGRDGLSTWFDTFSAKESFRQTEPT